MTYNLPSKTGNLCRAGISEFLFHATTAYNIRRHNGLEIGKQDLLGEDAHLRRITMDKTEKLEQT